MTDNLKLKKFSLFYCLCCNICLIKKCLAYNLIRADSPKTRVAAVPKDNHEKHPHKIISGIAGATTA